ncbi:MAG: hypothetical protein ISP45_26725 [Reyranella sp.]|jgi:hypothetical protein|nr:hypothetical protein [Reyranella sp.]
MPATGLSKLARVGACVATFLLACPAAHSQDGTVVNNLLAIQLYGIGGGLVPFGVNSNVTAVDQTATTVSQALGFGSLPFDIGNQQGGSSTTTAFLGARVQVPFLWRMADEQHLSFSVFFETGIQTGFAAQSFMQSFQNTSVYAGDYGTSTISEFYQIPLLLGFTLPVGERASGAPGVLFDVYGGLTLDSWQQTLQGAEAGAPGQQGFYAQNRRFTADPTIGVGLRVPVGDLRDNLPFFFGVNAELQFRPGSVVSAPSQNFPVTYYGTVEPHANLAIMARFGVAFGGR